jgi:hypothetical protein
MPHKRLILVCFIVLITVCQAAYGEDEFKSKVLGKTLSADECQWSVPLSTGDFYFCVPRQLMDNFGPDRNPFDGLKYDDIISIYQIDIQDRLSKGSSGKLSDRLLCMLKLNDSQRELINVWLLVIEARILNMKLNDIKSLSSEEIRLRMKPEDIQVLHVFIDKNDELFRTNCENYNKIAAQCERNGMAYQAEDAYRKVLQGCYKFQGPFREAEISLQNIRKHE